MKSYFIWIQLSGTLNLREEKKQKYRHRKTLRAHNHTICSISCRCISALQWCDCLDNRNCNCSCNLYQHFTTKLVLQHSVKQSYNDSPGLLWPTLVLHWNNKLLFYSRPHIFLRNHAASVWNLIAVNIFAAQVTGITLQRLLIKVDVTATNMV